MDTDAHERLSKFILCVLLTQMGKTFTAISKIMAGIQCDDYLGRSIHLIFTMNTLLNNAQFAKRLETVEQRYGPGSVCVFASKYNGKYTHVKTRVELQGICFDRSTCPRVVVMCSNTKRYDDGVEFLKIINSNDTCVSRAEVHLDELHNYINDQLRGQIEEIHELDKVTSITALTASPDKIWRNEGFWSNLRLIKLNNYSDSNYAGYKDMIFNCVDDFFANPYVRPRSRYDESNNQTVDFVKHVLTKYPDILGDNSRTFIPAHVLRKGHNMVRDLVFSIKSNAVVVVINGVDKILQYKDSIGNIKTIPLTSNGDEVCETISNLTIQHKLQGRPFVITGFLCVGMGQTLTHKLTGSFTSAIFGHLDLSNDEIYQLFGRITGRMKDWGDRYVQTQVYCPTTIMHRCNVMEECARNMANEHNGELVTREDYREPMNEMGAAGQSAIANIRIEKTKRPKKPVVNDDCTTVPIVIQLTQEQFKSILRARKCRWNFDNLYGLVPPSLKEELNRICAKPVDNECPNPAKEGYKKKITAFIEAAHANKKLKTWHTEITKNPTKDNFVIYLDKLEYRIIVSIYYGSKSLP